VILREMCVLKLLCDLHSSSIRARNALWMVEIKLSGYLLYSFVKMNIHCIGSTTWKSVKSKHRQDVVIPVVDVDDNTVWISILLAV